jgi:hypothetical protein
MVDKNGVIWKSEFIFTDQFKPDEESPFEIEKM